MCVPFLSRDFRCDFVFFLKIYICVCGKCVAVCSSMLQCVEVCCGVLQCVEVCCSVLQCVCRCVFPFLSHVFRRDFFFLQSYICVCGSLPWLIPVCTKNHFLCVLWLIPTCTMTHIYEYHESWTSSVVLVTWFPKTKKGIFLCHDSYFRVWNYCSYVPWLIPMCARTHSYVWHDSFLCVP